ncbi:hypothetical protein pdul_cds_944 [Pandoravirus dulcis]|uniref:Uncharacterized protein n=1 Tax=Pandoravirus dulcis TaxID=1349409 RepID=A0A291AU81_9VIRU|nr:hypothetical protein pdul_cds_944 [Pandoravirus dulcis]ATE82570.1 hypothetical protein pdul_cds_944 [Pandoravirus dulcis]
MHQAAEEWLATTGLKHDVFDDDDYLSPTQDSINLGQCASIEEYRRRYNIKVHKSATGASRGDRTGARWHPKGA